MLAQSIGSAWRLRDYALALFNDWRMRYALRRSLQAMTSEDRDRVLREIALDPAELDVCLNSVFGSEDLLSRLMRAISLDVDGLRARSPAVMRDLERNCMTCHRKRKCRAEQSRGRAAISYRDFCPNAQTFDRLAESLHVSRLQLCLERRSERVR